MQTRIVLSCLGTALACLLATTAGADGELDGHDWLRGKNTEHQAVLIGHDVYHLGAQTQIKGLDGETLSLADLIWIPELEDLEKIPRVPTVWVEYDATRVGDRLLLNWMQLSIDQEGLDHVRLQEHDRDRFGRIPGGR
jgi:hypothetical protein